MRVPLKLAESFKDPFEERLEAFLLGAGLIEEPGQLRSRRFLTRSVLPHVTKLSSIFNRQMDDGQGPNSGGYWKKSSNPEHLRLAYFLAFMPPNLFRAASIWSELGRLGYRWPTSDPVRAIDFGSGPATVACGIAAAEAQQALGLPAAVDWAMIDRDKTILDLGTRWYSDTVQSLGLNEWTSRTFARKLDIGELLPQRAPKFHLWTQSFFMNEWEGTAPAEIAEKLLETWQRHLEEEGLVIWIEPALKAESRKLLEIRRELLGRIQQQKLLYQLLLPCLGHQACGALAEPTDWCHEEVTWWRPQYLKLIDELAELDRKSLPFSYLVLARTRKSVRELLPALGPGELRLERLVSPSHYEGRDQEFYLCGADGKKRARIRHEETFERGDVLIGPSARGDVHSFRLDSIERKA